MADDEGQIFLHPSQRDHIARKTPTKSESVVTSHSYLRITRRDVPPNMIAENLKVLALIYPSVLVVEGYLLHDLKVGESIRFQACFQGGIPHHRRYSSSEVIRLEGEFVLTRRSLFQILRVPPVMPFDEEAGTRFWANIDDILSEATKAPAIPHTKDILYQVQVYSVPIHISVPDLRFLALMGYAFAEFCGYMQRRPMAGRTLNFLMSPSGTRQNRRVHTSTRVVRSEGQYFMTEHCLYHVQPRPSAGEEP